MSKHSTTPFMCRLTKRQMTRLKQVAVSDETSVAETIRTAVDMYLAMTHAEITEEQIERVKRETLKNVELRIAKTDLKRTNIS